MQSPDVHAVLAKLGADAAASTPEEFGTLIDGEIARWARVTKAANIRVE